MPELPEVETIRLGLNRLIVGKQIMSARTDNPKSFPNSDILVSTFMVGKTVLEVRRRAKLLVIDLDNDYSLLIHLKMTGQLVYDGAGEHFRAGHPNSSLISRLPDRSTRVDIAFTDSSHLYFNDQRKFGWMRLLPTIEIAELSFFQRLGPEPLEVSSTWQMLAERIVRRSRSPIKPVIMDQSIIAGVGNIYADEGLWTAHIHPAHQVGKLSNLQIEALFTSIRQVLILSLANGGSTDKNYVDAEGNRGTYLEFANVFRRQGQPCTRCGTLILKIKLAGRGTHFCPVCQPAEI